MLNSDPNFYLLKILELLGLQLTQEELSQLSTKAEVPLPLNEKNLTEVGTTFLKLANECSEPDLTYALTEVGTEFIRVEAVSTALAAKNLDLLNLSSRNLRQFSNLVDIVKTTNSKTLSVFESFPSLKIKKIGFSNTAKVCAGDVCFCCDDK